MMLKLESASLMPANHAFESKGVESNPLLTNRWPAFLFDKLYQSINLSNLCTLGVRIFPLILLIKSFNASSSYTVQTTSFEDFTSFIFP
jgi:hypothetical protein